MIDRIYRIVAEKTEDTKTYLKNWAYKPVMIGDILQYVEKDYYRFTQNREIKEDNITGDIDYSIDRITYKILELRTKKTEPINNQSEICIKFIYSIVQ